MYNYEKVQESKEVLANRILELLDEGGFDFKPSEDHFEQLMSMSHTKVKKIYYLVKRGDNDRRYIINELIF